MYIPLAMERARSQPTRSFRASSRLARAIVAANFRFQIALRFLHRSDCRLSIVLRGYRLGRRQSCIGISGGLMDSQFELRDIGAAGTGLRKGGIEAEHRNQQQAR
jgi:hypothetical protein